MLYIWFEVIRMYVSFHPIFMCNSHHYVFDRPLFISSFLSFRHKVEPCRPFETHSFSTRFIVLFLSLNFFACFLSHHLIRRAKSFSQFLHVIIVCVVDFGCCTKAVSIVAWWLYISLKDVYPVAICEVVLYANIA